MILTEVGSNPCDEKNSVRASVLALYDKLPTNKVDPPKSAEIKS